MLVNAFGIIMMVGCMVRLYRAYRLSCEYLNNQNKLKSELK